MNETETVFQYKLKRVSRNPDKFIYISECPVCHKKLRALNKKQLGNMFSYHALKHKLNQKYGLISP